MTAQVSDVLLFDGVAYRLLCEPLEAYFEQNPPRPKIEAICTACWRGYVASWRIRASKLYLEDLEGFDCEELALKKLFPKTNGPVFASWFTGPLICPKGDARKYVHMGYATTYEKYLIINIEHGMVSDVADLSHDEYMEWLKERYSSNH